MAALPVGADFAATIGGQTYDKRPEAGRALAADLQEVEYQHRGNQQTQPLGSYKGFDVGGLNTDRGYQLVISHPETQHPHRTASLDLSDVTPTGLMSRLDNLVRNIPARAKRAGDHLATAEDSVRLYAEQIAQPFRGGGGREELDHHERQLRVVKSRLADDPKLLQEGDDFDMDLEGDFDAGPREAPDVGDVTLRSAVESTRSPEAADTPAEVSDALEDVLGSPDTATTSAPDKSAGNPAPAMSKPDRAAGVASVAQVDPPTETPPESNKTAMARGYRRQKAELERAAAESETAQKREPEPQAAATVETPALERLRAAEVEDLEALEAWLDSKKKDPGPQARLDEAHRRLRAADKAAGATEPGSATAEQIATIKALHEITPTHGGEIQVRDSAGMSRKEAREAIARRADTATLNPPFDSNLLSLGRDAVRPRLLKLSEFLGDASSPVSRRMKTIIERDLRDPSPRTRESLQKFFGRVPSSVAEMASNLRQDAPAAEPSTSEMSVEDRRRKAVKDYGFDSEEHLKAELPKMASRYVRGEASEDDKRVVEGMSAERARDIAAPPSAPQPAPEPEPSIKAAVLADPLAARMHEEGRLQVVSVPPRQKERPEPAPQPEPVPTPAELDALTAEFDYPPYERLPSGVRLHFLSLYQKRATDKATAEQVSAERKAVPQPKPTASELIDQAKHGPVPLTGPGSIMEGLIEEEEARREEARGKREQSPAPAVAPLPSKEDIEGWMADLAAKQKSRLSDIAFNEEEQERREALNERERTAYRRYLEGGDKEAWEAVEREVTSGLVGLYQQVRDRGRLRVDEQTARVRAVNLGACPRIRSGRRNPPRNNLLTAIWTLSWSN